MDGSKPVRFRLLGPISLLTETGDVIQLRGAQQRCLLAILLLDPEHEVSVEQLVDSVWGEEPPATARALVQVHISRLRKALENAGLPTITHAAGGGYLLGADPDSVDLLRFRALVEQATHAADAVAEELFGQALSLWYGEPLSGAAGERLSQRFVPRLREERLRALEGRLERRLETHGPGAVLPTLTNVYAENPDREHLAVLLMRALQRAGRRHDALEAYRELRTHLVQTLGIEPAVATQEVHSAILRGTDEASRPPRAAVLPAQLPPALESLPGREPEMTRIRNSLNASGLRTMVLSGPPGYGKTSLALYAAHQERSAFPDGQLFADLGGARETPTPVSEILAGFLRAFGMPTLEVDSLTTQQRAAQLRSLLADRRVLMVLDDARDAAQVRPLLPAGDGCAVLVTTRATLSGLESATLVDLPKLSRGDGFRVLATEPNQQRLQADSGASNDILDACAGVPLALQIAASRLAARPEWTARDLAVLLTDERSVLDQLAVDDLAVRSSIQMSYRQLDAASARTFRLLALAGHDLGIRQAAALIDLAEPHAAKLLDRLTDTHLLTSDASRRFGMHDLLRVFGHERLLEEDSPEEHACAIRRLFGSYAADIFPAIELLAPRLDLELPSYATDFDGRVYATREDSIEWLETEFVGICRVMTLAARPGVASAQSLSQVLRALAHFADPHGHAGELESLALTVITACIEQDDDLAQGVALTVLGGAAMRARGHLAGLDHLREAARLLSGTGERAEATACNNLAVACDRLGLEDERLSALRRAAEVYDALADQRGQAIALVNLSDHQLKTGDFTAGLTTGREAIELAEATDVAEIRAAAYVNTGDAARQLHQLALAKDLLTSALELSERETMDQWSAEAHLALARTALADDELSTAATHYARAAEAFQTIGAERSAQDTLRERDAATTGDRTR